MAGKAAAVWLVDVPESPRGGYWTVSTSGLHSAVAASLSSVLEPEGLIPPKYFLSSKACQGILNRAARRQKTLPAMLEQALQAVAVMEPTAR
jgi:predicted nucleic acid-binding Zn ribbon protein